MIGLEVDGWEGSGCIGFVGARSSDGVQSRFGMQI
jgi:hypothetical protein